MAHKRKEFSNNTKAEIYVRDRATCCFSGCNLWLLDSPLRPGVQTDWVDHVNPSAKGGGNEIENGVCASHTMNMKKRHNGGDDCYLFENGMPSHWYYDMFGVLPETEKSRLNRLSKLRVEDWFFNRAIKSSLRGFLDRCDREYYETDYKRDDQYWFNAAYNKLADYQKLADGSPSLEERGIIVENDRITKSWLSIRDAKSKTDFISRIEKIYPHYKANFYAWVEYFWECESKADFENAYQYVKKLKKVTADVRECIEDHYQLIRQV